MINIVEYAVYSDTMFFLSKENVTLEEAKKEIPFKIKFVEEDAVTGQFLLHVNKYDTRKAIAFAILNNIKKY